MIFLAGSIVFSSFLTIAFKVCERLGINTFQAIIFNYLTCVLTGFVFHGGIPDYISSSDSNWAPWALLMGTFFIVFFNITAITVKRNGLAVASVANKLSLVVPFLFSLYLYNEDADLWNILGVIVALIAVVLTCYPQRSGESKKGKLSSYLLFPVILFTGSGIMDTLIKYTEQRFVNPLNRNEFLICCFTVAFIIGGSILIYKLFSKRLYFQTRAVFAGICIGIPNYLSIWCLVMVLDEYKTQSAAIIPVNNIGIVFLSTMVAWLLFREKLSAINWAGIVLAILSIFMITAAI